MWIEMHSLMVSAEGWWCGDGGEWEEGESFESRREASTKTPFPAVLGLGFLLLPLAYIDRGDSLGLHGVQVKGGRDGCFFHSSPWISGIFTVQAPPWRNGRVGVVFAVCQTG
jgi:hypothetical protein